MLTVKPTEIRLREIVELMENKLEPLDCINQHCLIPKTCRVKQALGMAQKKYLEHLEAYTIAGIVDTTTIIHRMDI